MIRNAVTKFARKGLLLLSALLAASASAQVMQFVRTDYPVGTQPAGVIQADFRGNGTLDLAVANSGSNTVSILLGVGDGTFGAKTDFPTGLGPESLVAGDFNGDGKMDLAVVNKGSNTVSILLGNGDGTFQAKTDFATGSAPNSIAAGDFNGDGKLDLAVVNNSSNSVSILLGNGMGSFGAKTDFATGSGPIELVTGDFNGDGKLDLAVANRGSATISILLGIGDGTFGAKTDFPADTDITALTAADFNGDKNLDLATANNTSDSISILLGKGDGTFDPKTDLGDGTGPIAVTAADFNADGKFDLATLGYVPGFCDCTGCIGPYGYANLFQGHGDGTFTLNNRFVTGLIPVSVATGDFNKDGNLDLVTANNTDNTVSVLLRNPVVTMPTGLDFGSQLEGTTSQAMSVAISNGGNPGSSSFTVSSVGLNGTFAGDFAKTADTCSGKTLAPGDMCSVSLTFKPSVLGTEFANLVLSDKAAGNPHMVPLDGTGTAALSLSVIDLAFPDQVVGTTSVAQSVTLADGTAGPVSITSIVASGDYGQTNNCGFSLAGGANCMISVTFTPAVVGQDNGTLTVNYSGVGSPQVIPLSGAGHSDFSFASAAGSSTSATIAAGSTATFTLNLAGTTAGSTGTVILNCSDPAQASICSFSVNPIALNGTTPTSVTVSVSTKARSLLAPRGVPPTLLPGSALRIGLPLLFALMSLTALADLVRQHTRWQRRAWAGLTATVLFAALSFGCGGGSSNGPPPIFTAPGQYNIVVTGTTGNVSHNMSLTVNVN